MSTAKLRKEIIEKLLKVEDLETLESINEQLKATDPEVLPLFMEAVKPIRAEASLEELMKEQNYQPITYKAFRAAADEIEWEASLDELLEALAK